MPPGASDDFRTPGVRARRTRRSLVLGGLVLAAVLSTRWVRLNISPSLPYGLYRLAPVSTPLARGTLAVVPVPPRVQAWHSRFVPLLKPVAAVAGDVVCVGDDGLWVAGQWYGPVWQQAHGMPLPAAVSANLLYGFGHVNLQNLEPCQTAAVCKPLPLPRVLEAKNGLRSWQEVVIKK